MVAFTTTLLPLLPLLSVVAASSQNGLPAHIRHRKHAAAVAAEAPHGARVARDNTAHAEAHQAVKKNIKKRQLKTCRKKDETPFAVTTASSAPVQSETAPASASESQGAPEGVAAWAQPGSSSVSSSTTSAWSQPSSSPPPSSGGGGGSVGQIGGLLSATGPCGASQADANSPNGQLWWINCGIDNNGWNPPTVSLDQLVVVNLDGNGAFSACAQYVDTFKSVGQQYGIPPVLLAAIAMQESGCNAGATGGNGEAGLMQLASMWCGEAPGGNCYDVWYNIQGGAKVFSQYYKQAGNSFFLAMGQYNGWRQGMTVGDATAAKYNGQCFAQNNLDYLDQIANGWLQGKDGHSRLHYNNLASC